MSTQEVAEKLVNHCRKGEFEQAMTDLYSHDIVSIEPEGANSPQRLEGIEAVVQKGMQFAEMTEEMHGMEVSDPIVADNYFSVRMWMDVTFKEMGRTQMEEICVYGVKDGKIVFEQFHYTTDSQG